MARQRKQENKGLPARWQLMHGAYYYRVPDHARHLWNNQQRFRLGKTLPEAYRTWAKKMEGQLTAKTVGELLDRYALEVIPTKAAKTAFSNSHEIKKIRTAFGAMMLEDVTPKDVYLYLDARTAKIGGKREIALLSHAFTKAVEWGYIERHPFKGQVRTANPPPRRRYIEDWEIREALTIKPTRKNDGVLMIAAYIQLKLLCGLRAGDMLRLRMSDLQEDGIHVTPNKTRKSSGARIIIQWTDALREAVAAAKAARPVHISPWLFCTRRGTGYMNETIGVADGFKSIWNRWMNRVLRETKVTDRFMERDLRAKTGSDMGTVERAQALLAHTDSRITRMHYRRKAENVAPLK